MKYMIQCVDCKKIFEFILIYINEIVFRERKPRCKDCYIKHLDTVTTIKD